MKDQPLSTMKLSNDLLSQFLFNEYFFSKPKVTLLTNKKRLIELMLHKNFVSKKPEGKIEKLFNWILIRWIIVFIRSTIYLKPLIELPFHKIYILKDSKESITFLQFHPHWAGISHILGTWPRGVARKFLFKWLKVFKNFGDNVGLLIKFEVKERLKQ